MAQTSSSNTSCLLTDGLYLCLDYLARQQGKPLNSDIALQALPQADENLTPSDLLDVARSNNINCALGKRRLAEIIEKKSGCILLLSDNRAALLDGDSGSFLLATDQGLRPIDHDQIVDSYLGYAILLNATENSRAGDFRTFNTHSPQQRLSWFRQCMWQFRSYYLQLLPAALLLNLFALSMPFFVMIVYDRVVPNQAVETLWVLAAGISAIFFFDLVLRVIRGLVLERAGRAMDCELGSRLFEQVISLSMRAVPNSTGHLTGRLRAYETLRDFFISATMLAIADLPFSIVIFAVVFYLGGPVGWILLVAALTAIVVSLALQIPLYRAVNRSADSGLERNSFLTESISQLETVKAIQAEASLQRRFKHLLHTSSHHAAQSHWYGLLANSWTTAVMHFTSVAIVLASVYRIQDGAMTMGGMIAVVMLSSRCLAPLAMIAGLMTRLQQALQSLQALNDIMQLPRESDGKAGQPFALQQQVSVIECRDLGISYPESPTPALQNINLQFKAGEKVAIIGRIGSGKSTLLKVIAGLYEPTDGGLMIDGIDARQYAASGLRRIMGYVPQDAALFDGTLLENLVLGMPVQPDQQTLQQAINAAGLGDFVKQHPHGIHAKVGERGSRLSGGQRRAVALARCLLRDPKILLLDEPTANLDPATERLFVQNLSAMCKNKQRGLLLVTHKPTLLEIVDRAIVLDGGKVLADGPPGQVIASLKQSKKVVTKKAGQRAVEEVG